ncbi:MAG: MBL fold metallo-hydrolase [Acidobacteriaceae bacterium]
MTKEKSAPASMTRRDLLRSASFALGGGVLAGTLPSALFAQTPARNDRLAQMRAAGATAKLTTTKLVGNVYSVIGSGGNMAVLDGPDGKLLIDSSFATTAPQLQAALAGISANPLKLLVNTHWHFDHTDGNQAIHKEGALILAHENTRKRMSTPQDLALMGMHFDPSPADALPQITFAETEEIYFNGQHLRLGHYAPAHTDTDIFIHFIPANVIHTGDIWFNGLYPVIDYSTGGNVNGMVAAAARTLGMADGQTIIIPGHGPVGNKAALQGYHDMLATVRDRVSKLKAAGKSSEEAVAAKPTAEFDAAWGHGLFTGDQFTDLVYKTL